MSGRPRHDGSPHAGAHAAEPIQLSPGWRDWTARLCRAASPTGGNRPALAWQPRPQPARPPLVKTAAGHWVPR